MYFKNRVNYEHTFAVCAIFKNEAPYLKDWVDYHNRVLGATKFYLYNNDSTDNYDEVLAPYIKSGLVELISWETKEEHALRGWLEPGASHNDYQIGAYNDCLKKRALGKVRWVAMIDIDEFIVPTHGTKDFKAMLSKRDNMKPFSSVGSLEIHWKVFGTSQVWDLAPGEKLLEKLCMRALDDHGWNRRQVKSIYRPEGVDICLIHKAEKMKKGFRKKRLSSKEINLNHYWLGTEKRLMEKRGINREEVEAFAAPFNLVEDKTILQYLELIG